MNPEPSIWAGPAWRVKLFFATGAAAAGIGLALLPVSREHALIALIVLGISSAYAEVLGVWLEERARIRQAGGVPPGLLKLVGLPGEVVDDCTPVGRVRIGFETWHGRSADGRPLPAGQRVHVHAIDGAILVVEPQGSHVNRS